jgi:translin
MTKNLKKVCDALLDELDEKDQARECALRTSRLIVRAAGQAITCMVRGETGGRYLAEARSAWSGLRPKLSDQPDIRHGGLLDSALEEYSEAEILAALVAGKALPTHDSLDVPSQVYICGFADCIGELRRLALGALDRSKPELASKYLALMCEMYDQLMRFDVPSSIAQVRRKQDVARALVERTQGEVTLGKLMLGVKRREK